jgi:SAM-dependent methyltransferase
MKQDNQIMICAACGSQTFASKEVLWQELIDAWQLSVDEARYINRQQGYHCQSCGNNLRSIGLAKTILRTYSYNGNLSEFCDSRPDLDVLEINTAGGLTQFLQKLPKHKLIEYPKFDMMNLDLESERFDIVVHSDSLEHVPFPARALSECRRVLRTGGICTFTVPLIVGRMSRSRQGLAPSYHGGPQTEDDDQIVHSEFGVDVWKYVLEAGFTSCEMVALEYPSAITIIAKK